MLDYSKWKGANDANWYKNGLPATVTLKLRSRWHVSMIYLAHVYSQNDFQAITAFEHIK